MFHYLVLDNAGKEIERRCSEIALDVGPVAPGEQSRMILTSPPLDELTEERWSRIKAERDRRRFAGGVKVAGKWFQTTTIATSEYNTLLLMSDSLDPATVLRADWRTMDGTTVDMTPALVKQILSAGFAQVAAIDDAAQTHKAAMLASPNPATYDYSTGWPTIFTDEFPS